MPPPRQRSFVKHISSHLVTYLSSRTFLLSHILPHSPLVKHLSFSDRVPHASRQVLHVSTFSRISALYPPTSALWRPQDGSMFSLLSIRSYESVSYPPCELGHRTWTAVDPIRSLSANISSHDRGIYNGKS